MPVHKEVKRWFHEQGGYFKGKNGIEFHTNGAILDATVKGATAGEIKKLIEHFGSDGGTFVYPTQAQNGIES